MAAKDEYFRRMAIREQVEGQHYEPRLYFAPFVFDGATQRVFAQPSIFRNGEKYPLRVTHLVMAAAFDEDPENAGIGDERAVQRYGLRVRNHGTYYQNPRFTALPLYANKPVAALDVISRAQSSWRFPRPFNMGNRDTFQVEVQLFVAPESGSERVTVTFQGLGLYSRQPKMLTGYVELSDTNKTAIDVDSFRNDGTEPLEVQAIEIHHAPSEDTANPVGNIRNVRLRVRLNGNGTNQWWNVGPINVTGWSDLVPAHLWGLETGRSIVHELPGAGWLFYPNEEIVPEMESFVTSREDTILLALAGYIIVPK